ncbi:hypothetical protein OUZ56_031621 [Daphnia magna]|uniref:GMP synthase n=1 Tax=Daphnia magna TaxID=35525 RepID=A0ABQ9ZV33_9CRUS|nr:hypothetical protein OUZ56_031621 [Daphnia magna]
MKFAVIFVIAMACAMAAPPTTNGGLSIEDGKNSVVKRSPAFGSGNQNVANPVVRKRRVGVIDGNGQVVDLDDDDLRFVTTDLTGRQVALTSKQNPISVANRVPVRTSFRGSGSSVGKATGHIVFVNSDDSNEMDDFDDIDDIDDLAIISSDGRIFPFANSQNGVGIISQSSALNTLTSPVAAAGRQIRMKSGAAQSKRASSSTYHELYLDMLHDSVGRQIYKTSNRETSACLSILRPGLIESAWYMATSRADAIKTHPHDSEMVRQLRLHGRVVEHLKDFHKDELRALGRELGLPAELLERHPYPGPGLSIRIICAEEPFMEADFGESQVLIRLMVDYANMAARNMPCSSIEIVTSEEERLLLEELSSHKPVCCHATANSHCRCSVFQRIFRQKINVVILHFSENSTNLLGKTGSKICRTMNHPEYICSMECLTRIW